MPLENQSPEIYKQASAREITDEDYDEDIIDEIDSREIFDHIREINDPEHPLTLEELNVVEENLIEVDNHGNKINISFTPTIPHCSMATLIGLSIRVKLLRCLPQRFKVRVYITPGTHVSEDAINKQLGDKERIAAALDNAHLVQVINQCLNKKQPVLN